MSANGQQDNNFTINGAEQLGSDINVGELVAFVRPKMTGA